MSEKSSPPVPDQVTYAAPPAAQPPQYGGGYQSGGDDASQPPPQQPQQQRTYAQPTHVYTATPAQPTFQPSVSTPLVGGNVVYGIPVQTAIVGQPGYVMYPHFPFNMVCPYCQANITTRVVKEPGTCAWLSCAGLALIGCFWGCCLIPFCFDPCLDTEHYCPNCNRLIARRNQLDC